MMWWMEVEEVVSGWSEDRRAERGIWCRMRSLREEGGLVNGFDVMSEVGCGCDGGDGLFVVKQSGIEGGLDDVRVVDHLFVRYD